MNTRAICTVMLVIACSLCITCKKEKCDNCNNAHPIAHAGPDALLILPADSLLLDGSASTDPDGNITTFSWKRIKGLAAVTFSNGAAATTIVRKLTRGIYQFELQVTDNGGLSSKDTMEVLVDYYGQNVAPVAIAGTDREIVLPDNVIRLDGKNSSDLNKNITNYQWIKIAGPGSLNIVDANKSQTDVTQLEAGIYQFELTVTDEGGLFSKDTVQITVHVAGVCETANRPLITAQLIPFGKLSQARSGIAVVAAGNKIIFAGGSTVPSGIPPYRDETSAVDIYDFATQAWTSKALNEPRSGIAAIAGGNLVLLAGGEFVADWGLAISSRVDIYDAANNTWFKPASLSDPRSAVATAVVGNEVLFAGGINDYLEPSKTVDMFNFVSHEWSTYQGVLSIGRGGMSAVTINNKVYFAGGNTEHEYPSVSNRIDVYDEATQLWSTSDLSKPMGLMAGVTVGNNIYWASGCTVEIRNVITGLTTIDHLSTPGSWENVDGQNAVIRNNKIIYFRHTGNNITKFDIYDIATKSWSIGVLPVSLSNASVISVNNVIYLAGGLDDHTGQLMDKVWKVEF